MAKKCCTQCHKVYPAIKKYFPIDKRSIDGLAYECKVCHNKRGLQYRQSEKGKIICKQTRQKYRNTIKGHLHVVYDGMKQRCNNPKRKDYKDYGGRGIKLKFKSPDEFINYIINVLKIDPRGLAIDRINNNGNYEPNNIRFVTTKQNANNRKREENGC